MKQKHRQSFACRCEERYDILFSVLRFALQKKEVFSI